MIKVLNKDIRSNILPIAYPMAATHAHVAHSVALLSTERYTNGWMMSCFIQIRGEAQRYIEYQDFWILDCPILRCQRIGLDLVRDEWKKEIYFIKCALEHGYYVYAMIDTYPISSYGDSSYMHDVLIYGYDDREMIFYIADFFQGRKYDFSTSSYEEMHAAFQCRDKVREGNWVFYDDIILLKARYDEKAVFEPAKVRGSLESYLKGRPLINTFQRTRNYTPMKEKDNLFGVNCYQILHRHINYTEENGEVLDTWLHVFHIMFEHKSIMVERIRYMKQENYIVNADKYLKIYEELTEKMLMSRNLYLKYSICKDRNIMKKIRKIITEVKDTELNILPDMIHDIDSKEIAYDISPRYY